MSSIISDIFYNSKNNALFDQFLLENNSSNNNILPGHQLQLDVSNNKHNDYNKKLMKSRDRQIFDQEGDYRIVRPQFNASGEYQSMKQDKITLKLKISISPQPNSRDPSSQPPIKPRTLYLLKLKLGLTQIQQDLESSPNPNSTLLSNSLQLQLPQQQIYTHPALSIQLYQSSKATLPIGCCYLPMANVRSMVEDGIGDKMFGLVMKCKPKGRGRTGEDTWKYRVSCELTVQLEGNRIDRQYYNVNTTKKPTNRHQKHPSKPSSRTHSRNQSSQQRQYNIVHNKYLDMNKNNHYAGFNKYRKQTDRIMESSSKYDNSKDGFRELYREKQERGHFKVQNRKLGRQSSKSNDKSGSISYLKSDKSGNQTSQNLILKHQLENKPTKFCIKQYIPKQSHTQKKDKKNTQYRFIISINNSQNRLNDVKLYSIDEAIVIYSAEIDRKGIRIGVVELDPKLEDQDQAQDFHNYNTEKQEKEQDVANKTPHYTYIGYFHLNIVIMLGGYINGVFPVNNQERANECIGLVRIQSLELNQHPVPQSPILHHLLPNLTSQLKLNNQVKSQGLNFKVKNNNINGYALDVCKLYAMPKILENAGNIDAREKDSSKGFDHELSKFAEEMEFLWDVICSQPEVQILFRLADGTVKVCNHCSIAPVLHSYNSKQLLQQLGTLLFINKQKNNTKPTRQNKKDTQKSQSKQLEEEKQTTLKEDQLKQLKQKILWAMVVPLLEIVVHEPIVIRYGDVGVGLGDQVLQIQVYINYQLISYLKTPLKSMSDSQPPPYSHIHYGTLSQTLATDQWICNTVINYVRFSIEQDYIPEARFNDSLECLLREQLWTAAAIAGEQKERRDRSEVEDSIVRMLLAQQNGRFIYIQAKRIAHLLIDSISNQNYCLTKITDSQPITKTKKTPQPQIQNKQRFLEQLNYLDEKNTGYVPLADLQAIMDYYIDLNSNANDSKRIETVIQQGMDKEKYEEELQTKKHKAQFRDRLIQGWRRGWTTSWGNYRNMDVLYLGILANVVCQVLKPTQPLFILQQGKYHKEQIQEQKRKIAIDQPLKILDPITSAKLPKPLPYQTPIQSPSHLLQALSCTSMHRLMHNSSIPSLRVRISRLGFTTKPYYSCANPFIRINRRVVDGDVLILLHYNVKMGEDVEIGRVVLKGLGEANGEDQGLQSEVLVFKLNKQAQIKAIFVNEFNKQS